MIKRTRIL